MKAKRDPVFGVLALKELGEKASTKIKPFAKRSERKKKIRIRNTELYRHYQRYVYTGEE